MGEREQGAGRGEVSESEELSAEMWLLWGLGRSGGVPGVRLWISRLLWGPQQEILKPE